MIRTIDVKYKNVDFKGIAFYIVDDKLADYLSKTHRDHEIVGFQWNPDRPSELGIIFKKLEPG